MTAQFNGYEFIPLGYKDLSTIKHNTEGTSMDNEISRRITHGTIGINPWDKIGPGITSPNTPNITIPNWEPPKLNQINQSTLGPKYNIGDWIKYNIKDAVFISEIIEIVENKNGRYFSTEHHPTTRLTSSDIISYRPKTIRVY